MGEDEAYRVVEAQQQLFVFQDQVVGGNVVGLIAAALGAAVNRMALFIYAEIALVRFRCFDATQVFLVRFILKQGEVVVQDAGVFLLEHDTVQSVLFIAVFIVHTVLCDFVDEEEGQGLDAQCE